MGDLILFPQKEMGNIKRGTLMVNDFNNIDNADINNQRELSEDYFDRLSYKGRIQGGRSGSEVPLTAEEKNCWIYRLIG